MKTADDAETYRENQNRMEEERTELHIKLAAQFVAQAACRLSDAREFPQYRRPHSYAAETFLRAALAVMELGR